MYVGRRISPGRMMVHIDVEALPPRRVYSPGVVVMMAPTTATLNGVVAS